MNEWKSKSEKKKKNHEENWEMQFQEFSLKWNKDNISKLSDFYNDIYRVFRLNIVAFKYLFIYACFVLNVQCLEMSYVYK